LGNLAVVENQNQTKLHDERNGFLSFAHLLIDTIKSIMKQALCFLLVILLLIKTAKSQIISYPRYYYGNGTNMPFDKEFDLLVPFKEKQNVYYIYLYKHRGNTSFLESIQKEKGSLPHVKLNSTWEKSKTNDTNYTKVEFRYIPAEEEYSLLKPSRIYSLIFFKGVTEGSRRILSALRNEYTNTGSIAPNGPAYLRYTAERDRQITQNKITTYNSDFAKYDTFYSTKIKPLEESLRPLIEADTSYRFPCESSCVTDGCLGSLLALVNGKGCTPVGLVCQDTCQVMNSLFLLKKRNCQNLTTFLQGQSSLEDIDKRDQYLAISKREDRKARLNQSIIVFRGIEELLLSLKGQLQSANCSSDTTCLYQLRACINTFLQQLEANQTRVARILKINQDMMDAIVESRLFIDYEISDVNTYVYNFQARNEMAITPVFGYAYYGFQEGFSSFTPYLGFQVNFQGLDRDVPFNQIPRKTIWQRLCFTTAWTLTGVAEQNKRADLFEKSSLITALGFKLSHVLMLNAGTLWFQKQNKNVLISDKTIAATPVLSLSVNLEIDKLLNGFTKLIPVK
jgi:hypothetical protein